ncbi:MAG: FecR family protein [Halanaerobiales bacterium]
MRNNCLVIIFIIFLSLCYISAPAAAENVEIGEVDGEVQRVVINILGLKGWQKFDSGDSIDTGDRIRTGEDSRMELVYDNAVLLMDAETEIVIEEGNEIGEGRSARVKVTRGRIWTTVKKVWEGLTSFEAVTPTAVAGVRGTVFSLGVEEEGTTLSVKEGRVRLEDREKTEEVEVESGQMARVDEGRVGTPEKIDGAEEKEWEVDDIKDWVEGNEGKPEVLPPPAQGEPAEENGIGPSEEPADDEEEDPEDNPGKSGEAPGNEKDESEEDNGEEENGGQEEEGEEEENEDDGQENSGKGTDNGSALKIIPVRERIIVLARQVKLVY